MADEALRAFQPDRPGDISRGDLFGHGDYARVLGAAVLDTERDYTFGLFGDWGLGKTTVLNAMTEQLRGHHKKQCAVAVFDAWRYQADPFRREFLRELDKQLTEHHALRDWDREKYLGPLDEETSRTHDVGLKLSRYEAVRAAVVVAILAAVLFGLLGGVVFSPAAGTLAALVAVMPLLGFLIVRLENVFKVQQVTVSRKRLEDPDRFAAVFRTLVGHVDRDVLVIAIDNLDRLPAAEAVEVLATIKTFLEPEAEAARLSMKDQLVGKVDIKVTRVVFVVAVDDGALRRHLQTLAPKDSPDDDASGRRHADEYLRKFFNASITLRPLLSGDLSEYIRGQLEPVFDRAQRIVTTGHYGDRPPRDLPAQLEHTVEMAVIALRRNPRRVRQFVGNLELQLRLLRERETSHGVVGPLIDPPVSGNVALVAKLELLAEEWPKAYDKLRSDEGRWEAWHRGVTEPDELSPSEWQSLAPMLHASRDIDAGMLRAVLRVKRAKDEIHILDFDEFRESVIRGDRGRLLRYELALRERAERDAAMPAEMLPRLFNEERRAGHLDSAMNVVDAVLFFFGDDEEVSRKTLSDALADEDTAHRLASLDPDKLVEAGRLLSQREQVKILELLALSLKDGAASEREHQIIERLAERVAELDDAGRKAVSAAIEAMVDQFAAYAPLVRADPSLLPPQVSAATLEWLKSATPVSLARLVPRGRAGRSLNFPAALRLPPFEIMRAAVRVGAFEGSEDALLEALSGLLQQFDGDALAAHALADFAVQLEPAVRRVERSQMQQFVAAAGGALRTPGVGVSDRLRLLHACCTLLDLVSDESDVATELVEAAALSDTALASHVLAHLLDLPASLRSPVLRRLRSAPDDERVAAARGSLDRTLLARTAKPEQVALALTTWMQADSTHLERLRDFAELAAGLHPSGWEQPAAMAPHALRVEDLVPEDPRDVDPGLYVGRIVLGVTDGDARSSVVAFRGRLRLSLTRADDGVDAKIHDVGWAGSAS